MKLSTACKVVYYCPSFYSKPSVFPLSKKLFLPPNFFHLSQIKHAEVLHVRLEKKTTSLLTGGQIVCPIQKFILKRFDTAK